MIGVTTENTGYTREGETMATPGVGVQIAEDRSVFLSHSSQDKAEVEALRAALDRRGIACFLDALEVTVEDRLTATLKEKVEETRAYVVDVARQEIHHLAISLEHVDANVVPSWPSPFCGVDREVLLWGSVFVCHHVEQEAHPSTLRQGPRGGRPLPEAANAASDRSNGDDA